MAVTLRFPGHALAQFTVSYVTDRVDFYVVAGTKGVIQMTPATGFGEPREQVIMKGGTRCEHDYKPTDQFGGQIRYFSDCILKDRDPESDAEEELADVVVLEAIMRAIDTGTTQPIEPGQRFRRIDPDAQEQKLAYKAPPKPVNASGPARHDV